MGKLSILLIAVIATVTFGCAAPRPAVVRSSVPPAPATQAAEANTPDALPLERIDPIPVMPSPRVASTTRATTQPSLDAIELYARARGAQISGDRLGAISQLQRAIATDPDSFELRMALARAYTAANDSGEKVLEALAAAEKIQPDNLQVQLSLGRQYLVRNDLDNALLHLRLAAQTSDYRSDDDQAALADFFLARALQQKGYDRAALDTYDKLIQRLQHATGEMRANPEIAYLVNRPDGLYGDIG